MKCILFYSLLYSTERIVPVGVKPPGDLLGDLFCPGGINPWGDRPGSVVGGDNLNNYIFVLEDFTAVPS